ncbi:cyclic AMP-dependent transcription factor ATF-1 isoform X1 [Callorhinchus milii]|uniref:Activating transcription factor 1 n=1 Tax=Callorhinchus milii TaxID=7868 RepID=V9KPL7_CALMI|nr:cyclic AMP-dependent transcription factor ATF-1 isoform X1 [Callorhinchus milii]XP_042200190.1 cyclic AMP-dependent transcription factor ATF-1 isoform X1 [Callorhinchus milii]XP_042200191.1 cyclic AMP-dependent transcription factor ATF-1 isoform X1 [Callorhinchus milii]|eukprot:gi/632981829/ref/XP_007907804.1/ PREDICTED: cyclic AMP-dependent transcription factor ATF-1-like [Callorhinchus milii]
MEEVQHDGSNSTDAGTQQHLTIQASQLSQLAQQVSMGGSTPVTVLQLPGGQSVHVQGVIQTAQSSVIQAPQIQSVQVSALSESEDSQESSDSVSSSQKSREILSRRPSYRKILNELSSGDSAQTKNEGKGDEEAGATPITTMTVPTPIYQTSTGQYIAIAPGGTIQLASPGSDSVQGLQTLTMTNAGGTQQGATILQYAQTADGQQILVPSNQVVVQTASGDVQTYQIRTTPTTNSLPQTVMMTSPVTLQPQSTKAEDATLKREIRLMKNREAARECRRKKKEYVKCLENRVAVLENQNKTLIEELKTLKDLYCHKSV